jgi:hypothetical protein
MAKYLNQTALLKKCLNMRENYINLKINQMV